MMPAIQALAMDTLPPLKPEFLAMMAKGVSLMLASCDHALNPSVMRAMGSLVQDEGRHITAYLGRAQARQLLANIHSSGRLSAVFSQPSTHLTLQLKSRRVRLRDLRPEDEAELLRYRLSMEQELAALGFLPVHAQALLALDPAGLVAVEFQPDEAYDQTPGASAGRALNGPPP
jgi:hypothetical protein